MKAYNVHARLGRCDGFLMLPTALQSQIVEQVQSILSEQNQEYEGRADSTSANSGEIATPGQTAQGGAPHPIAAPAPASEAVAVDAFFGTPGVSWESMRKLGEALGKPNPISTEEGQSIEDALVCMAAERLATPTPGDSADAPVQQAGDEQDLIEAKALAESEGSRAVKYLRIIRKVRAVLDEWPEVDIAGSPPSRIRTIIAFAGTPAAASEAVEPWMEKEAKYEAQMRETHAALKGEQPVEPSGTERGNGS